MVDWFKRLRGRWHGYRLQRRHTSRQPAMHVIRVIVRVSPPVRKVWSRVRRMSTGGHRNGVDRRRIKGGPKSSLKWFEGGY